MKKKILLLMGVFSLGLLQAQVGINTNNPLGVFHIDTSGNSTAVGVNDSDDFIVTANGNVGVATSNPQRVLHVKGDMRYSDGTEYEGYVLRATNNDGDAYWSEQRLLNQIILPDQANIETIMAQPSNNVTPQANPPHYTGLSITLPTVGTWKIFLKGNYRQTVTGNVGYYVVWSISKSGAINTAEEIAYSGYSGSTPNSAVNIMVVSNCTFVIPTTIPNQKVYLWMNGVTQTHGVSGNPPLNRSYVPGDGFNLWALPMD